MGRRFIGSIAKFVCFGVFAFSTSAAFAQDIGLPVSADVGQTILLDPSDRVTLPSGEPLSIEWTWQSRPATSVAAFSDTTALRPAVTLDIAGTYTARATFLTQAGVIVGEADAVLSTENLTPVAAIQQRSVPGSDTVTLDASPSLDVDGDSISYEWSLIAPSGSTLPASNSQTLWTLQPDVAGSYVAELVVVDSLGQRSDVATTEFLAVETPQGLALSNPPVARALFDAQVQSATNAITLNPTGSTDVNGDRLSSAFEIAVGPTALTVNADGFATLEAVSQDTLVILDVSDGIWTNQDQIIIASEGRNIAPTARIDAVNSSAIGQALTLNGRQSFDLNGDALDYNWALLSAPTGSVSGVASSGPGQAAFSPDVIGDYVVQLAVSDPMGATSFATQLIRVDQPLPTADAGRDQFSDGTFAQLNGTGSSGSNLTYTWCVLGVDAGAFGSLDTPNLASPVLLFENETATTCGQPLHPLTRENLLVNGSFEAPVITQNFEYAGTIDGWRTLGDVVEIWQGGQVASQPHGASDGAQHIELDSTRNVRNGIEQDVQTTAGQTYDLTLDVSRRRSTSSGTNTIDVFWNGSRIGRIRPTDYEFKTFAFAVEGTGGIDTLTFVERVNDSGSVGALVDNVVMSERPDTGAQDRNLVVNGSFEDQGPLRNFQIFGTLTGWQIAHRAEVWRGGQQNDTNPVATDGILHIELDANRDQVDSISQSIDTEAGETYTFSFDLAQRFQSGTASLPDTNTVIVFWNDEELARIDPDSYDFETASFSVTGTGSDTIRFNEEAGDDNSYGALIDNVRVVPQGGFVAQLIVENETGVSIADTVFVSDGNLRPTLSSATFEQNAGEDILLDALQFSSDANGDTLTYRWSLLRRPEASLATVSTPNDPTLTFTPDAPGTYLIQLEAMDGTLAAIPVVFTITVTNSAPIAAIDAPSEGFVGDILTLNGAGSFDPNGDAITFDWRVIAAPDGSAAGIADPFAVSIPFTPDRKGQYTLQLTVSDFELASDPVTAIITVPNRAPVAVLSGPADVPAESVAMFDATGSNDPDNDPLTFALTVLSGPDTNATIEQVSSGMFELVAATAGDYIVELTVDDGEVQATTISNLTVLPNNAAPILGALASPYTIEVGQNLLIALTATDADDDPLTFFARPLPLPQGMALDITTGRITFSPEAGQEGEYILTVGVSDGLLSDEATIIVSVVPPMAGETAVSGRVLDANDFANGVETPLANMPVRLGTNGQTGITNPDGTFSFASLTSGSDIILVEPNATGGPGSYLATQRPVNVIENQNRSLTPDILLVPLNEGCAVVTAGAPTQLVGPSGVTVKVDADTILDTNGDPYTGEVCLAAMPQQTKVAGLPEDTLACQVYGVSAAGAQFTSGLQLSAPNLDNLPETSQLTLWQQNASTGTFGRSAVANVDAGAVTVSGMMAPLDGGALFTFLPQSPRIVASADQPTGMHTLNMFEGDLNELYTLPGYRAFDETQQVSLSYHSQAANPTVFVAGDVTISSTASLPNTLSSRIEVGGLSIDDAIEWTPRQSLNGSAPALIGEEVVLRQSTPVDASELVSARYDYQFVAQAKYDCSTVEASFASEFYVRNESDSPYGTGWSIDELQTLVENPDGSIAILDDDTITTFDPQPVLGAFDDNPTVLPAIGPQGIVTGDFDGNGLIELAWADSGTGTIQVAEYNGTDAAEITRIIPVAEPNDVEEGGYVPNLRDIGLGDLTGNGQDDFAYTLYLGQDVGALEDAGAAFPNDLDLGFLAEQFGTFSKVADLNADGYDDLVIGQVSALQFGSGRTFIDWAAGGPDGLGSFQRIFSPFLTNQLAFQAETGDVDGDGKPELFVRNSRGFQVYTFDGTNGTRVFDFSTRTNIYWNYNLGNYLTVGDFNNDGLDDVAMSSASRLFVFFNTTAPDAAVTYGPITEIVRPAEVIDAPYLEATDTNGDGIDDLIISGEDSLYVYVANGDGTFQPVLSSPLNHDFEFIEITDFNGDGSLDLVSSQRFSITVDYSIPTDDQNLIAGNGEFSTLTALPSGGWERRYKDGTLVTFDADGRQIAMSDPRGNTKSYTYDAEGRLASIEDQVAGITTFVYGAGGQLASVTSPDGRVTSFEQDANGAMTGVTQADDTEIRYAYDENGQLTAVTDPRAFATTHTYSDSGTYTGTTFPNGATIQNQAASSLGLDSLGGPVGPVAYVDPEDRISVHTDEKGGVSAIEVNGFGAIIASIDAVGRYTLYERNDDNLVTSLIRPTQTGIPAADQDMSGLSREDQLDIILNLPSRVDTMIYDTQGNLVRQVLAEGTADEIVKTWTYEPVFSNPISMVNGDGFETLYVYNSFGEVISVTDPEGGASTMTRNVIGKVEVLTDAKGNTTSFTYDPFSFNLTQVITADGAVMRYAYDVNGNVTAETMATGTPAERTVSRAFDELDRLTSEETLDANGFSEDGTMVYGYDATGNMVSITDETGEFSAYNYDGMNDGVSEDVPGYGQIFRTYNDAGELVAETGPEGGTMEYDFDLVGRVTRMVDKVGNVSLFTYDVSDNLISVTDGRGNETVFAYDVLNRRTARTNPLGQTIQMGYDDRDNLTLMTREDGRSEAAVYDGNGRRVSVVTPDNQYTFAFDPNNNLTAANDNDSGLSLAYDNMDRLIGVGTDGVAGTQPGVQVDYTRDIIGQRQTMDDNLGGVWSYQFDDRYQVTGIIAPWGDQHSFGYDAANRPVSIDTTSGRETRAFYQSDRLTELAHSQNNVLISRSGFNYEVDGQIGEIRDLITPANSEELSYDLSNRLVQVSQGDLSDTQSSPIPTEDYAYDETGNRTVSHLSNTYVVDDHNRLLEDDEYTYAYDVKGNRTQRVRRSDGRVETYVYDSINQLVGVTSTDGLDVSYAYDAFGRRISKTVNGTVTSYVYDIGSLRDVTTHDRLMEFEDGVLTRRWVHGQSIDEPLSYEEYAGDTTPGAGQSYSLHADRQGSVIAVTNHATGQLVARYIYDAFGQREQTVDTIQQDRGFTGREFDAETGLYYYRARYYDPALGRFLQSDPLGFAAGDLNLYAYTWNDPANWTDPSGLSSSGSHSRLSGAVAGMAREAAKRVGKGAMCAAKRISTALTSLAVSAASGRQVWRGRFVARPGCRTGFIAPRCRCGGGGGLGGLATSFVAGTQVQTPNGRVAIEDLREGDLVVARDEDTGISGSFPITALMSRTSPSVLWVMVESEEGETSRLGITAEHPIFAEGRGWTSIGEMVPGDTIRGDDLRPLTILAITNDDTPQRVYNMEVADAHTYFAGEFDVWAHNARFFRGRLRDLVMGKNGGCCVRCGAPATQADHIMPWVRGGQTTLQNGQPLCGPCNRGKSCSLPVRGV